MGLTARFSLLRRHVNHSAGEATDARPFCLGRREAGRGASTSGGRLQDGERSRQADPDTPRGTGGATCLPAPVAGRSARAASLSHGGPRSRPGATRGTQRQRGAPRRASGKGRWRGLSLGLGGLASKPAAASGEPFSSYLRVLLFISLTLGPFGGACGREWSSHGVCSGREAGLVCASGMRRPVRCRWRGRGRQRSGPAACGRRGRQERPGMPGAIGNP